MTDSMSTTREATGEPTPWLHKRVFDVVCGCGMPEQAIGLIHDLLGFLEGRYNEAPKWPDPSATAWATWAATDETVLTTIIPDGPWRWAMWYWLDKLDLTEHGGSVPGWPTDKGRRFLAALDADQYFDEDGRAYHALDRDGRNR